MTSASPRTADLRRISSRPKQKELEGTPQEEKLKDKFETGEKDTIEKAVQQILEKNQLTEKDKLEAKQKELEGMGNPITMRVYQAAGGAGGVPGGGMPGGGTPSSGTGSSPTLEEVD